MKKSIYTFVLLLLVVAGLASYKISQQNNNNNTNSQGNTDNTTLENKQIEVKAFEKKDPNICKEIKGSSYAFGPTDALISIPQNEAIDICKSNIRNNVAPVEHGG